MKSYKKNFFTKNKIAIIILVRLNSRRLKKKALVKLHNISVIELLIKRLLKDLPKERIFICTNKNKDSKLKKIAKKNFVNYFEGSEKNIFKRIIDLQKVYKFKHFIRVTGDNPFTNTSAIKKMSSEHVKKCYEYTYTNSLPEGTRPEVISFEALKKANNLAIDPNSSEYMTYFFKRKIFKRKNIIFKKKNNKQNLFTITLDTKKDYQNIINNFSEKELFMSNERILSKICKIKNILINNKGLPKIKTRKYDVRFKRNLSNRILA
jgi:spore coat polysaccharide biosynthesis protein SpsF